MNNLTEKFVVLFLNGKEVGKEGVREINGKYIITSLLIDKYLLKNDMEEYNNILNKLNLDNKNPIEAIKSVKSLGKKKIVEIANLIIDIIIDKGLIYRVQSLLSLDVNYEVNKIKFDDFVAENKEYIRCRDEYKNKILLEGIDNETYYLTWLLMASVSLQELFTKREIELIEQKISKIEKEEIKALFEIKTLNSATQNASSKMNSKVATGFSFNMPFLNRKNSIFVPTEQFFTNSRERLEYIVKAVTDCGHRCRVISEGDLPIVEIDNLLFEAYPTSVRVYVTNVNGVRLNRFYK